MDVPYSVKFMGKNFAITHKQIFHNINFAICMSVFRVCIVALTN